MTIEDEKPVEEIRKPNKFTVIHSTAQVDRISTRIKENVSTLNYITPHFRAEGEVDVGPLSDGEVYTIGWVQAVTSMVFTNTYPTGQSSWEIEELDGGRAISDADGRQYPWYGVTTECKTIRGPCQAQRISLHMNDNFSPTVSWAVPVGKDEPDTLERIHRDQSFLVWLIVKNEKEGTILPLKAYRWRAIINIAIDCSRSIGERAKLLEPKIQAQPLELFDLRVPQGALQSPRANEAQKFVWRTLESKLVFEVSCSRPSSIITPSSQHSADQSRFTYRYSPY
jgi:hypothetical protein